MFKNQSIQEIQEIILEAVEQAWLIINSLIEPYLKQGLENPIFLASGALLLFGLPYSLYQIRKINREAESRYEKIVEQMDFDDDEPRPLETPSGFEDDDDSARPLFPESTNSNNDVLDLDEAVLDSNEETDDDAIDNLQDIADSMESEDPAMTQSSENAMENILRMTTEPSTENETQGEAQGSLDEGELDPVLKALLDDSFQETPAQDTETKNDFEEEHMEDQSILDLKAEMEDSINELQNQINNDDSDYNETSVDQGQDQTEDDSEFDEILKESFGSEAPEFDIDYEEDDPEAISQAEEIRKLQQEMEDSINQITGQISEPLDFKSISLPETTLDDLEDIESEGEEYNDILENAEETQLEEPLEEFELEEPVFQEENEEPLAEDVELPGNRLLEEELTLPEDLEDFKKETQQTHSEYSDILEPEETADSIEETESEYAAASNTKLEEELTLDDFDDLTSEETSEIEDESVDIPIEDFENSTAPEPKLDETVEEIPSHPEEIIEQSETVVKEEPMPALKTVVDHTVSRKVDRLVDRLTQFQEKIDNIQNIDPGAKKALSSADFLDGLKYQKAAMKSQNVKPALSDKEYMDLLESFIFLEDQNKK